MSFYNSSEYWNLRYAATATDKPCEWYRGYDQLRPFLDLEQMGNVPGAPLKVHKPQILQSNYFPSREHCRVLILGCGNSTMGEDMMQDGWLGPITNVDFSDVVISQMNQKYTQTFYRNLLGSTPKHPMRFVCADMTQPMPFGNESFDLIISKGSFDALLNGPKVRMHKVIAEIHRILAPSHGVFFLVTTGNPDNRLEYLEYKYELNHYWQGVSVHLVPPGLANDRSRSVQNKTVYVYLCRKNH